MKKILSFVVALCLLLTLSLAACHKDKQLDAPQNVKVSSTGLITWDAVDNAEGYEVTIGSNVYKVATNAYQANTASVFTASVVATADGYLNSEPSEQVTFTPSAPPFIDEDKDIKIVVRGSSEIREGVVTNLTATVTGTDNTEVTWSVVKGSQYVKVSNNGVVEVKDGVNIDGQKAVTVRATSVDDPTVYKDHPMEVIVPVELTQEMLNVFNGVTKASFEGFVKINAYTAGPLSDMDILAATQIKTIHTAMDGTNWYGEYDSTGTGVYQGVHFRNIDGIANQISITYTNQEELIPARDENNRIVTWAESGMYNSFTNLKVTDFRRDDKTWRHNYVGNNSLFMERVVSSSNPYEFEPEELSLIIDNGEVMGFRVKSKPSKRVIPGYTTVQEMYVVINTGETVNIPSIGRYSHEDIHDDLQVAIDNMRNLSNYKLDFRQTVYTKVTPGGVTSGYEEIVSTKDCYFRPYNISIVDGQIVPDFIEHGEYGYRDLTVNPEKPLYNSYSFNTDTNAYVAGRAFTDTFDNARPSMNFAAEIFRGYYPDEEEGTVTYYADPQMAKVASTFYRAVGNDETLYGLFATDMLLSIPKYPPYVVVKDGYIIEAGFFFNLGDMYGNIVITYSEFDTAELPENFTNDVTFETRLIPTTWDQVTIIASRDYLINHYIDVNATEDQEIQADEFLKTFLNRADLSDVPLMTKVLGDTYGFGLTGYYTPIGSKRAYEEISFYYDVPLDADYTITTSLQKIGEYLTSLGFVRNANGEYHKGDLWIAPIDNQLDLIVHMWRVV